MASHDGPPVDRGWAWMIALGSGGIFFVVSSITKTTGIIYAEILDTFHVNPVAASWIPSLLFFFMFSIAPIAGCVINRFSCRASAMLGSSLSTIGLILCMFVNSIELLYLCFGALMGIGISFSFNAGIAVLPIFFKKRLALANALNGVGAAAGGIVGPVLIRYLLDEYGFRGCCLLLGGLMLNVLPFAALFRSMSFYTSPNPAPRHKQELTDLNDNSEFNTSRGKINKPIVIDERDVGRSKISKTPNRPADKNLKNHRKLFVNKNNSVKLRLDETSIKGQEEDSKFLQFREMSRNSDKSINLSKSNIPPSAFRASSISVSVISADFYGSFVSVNKVIEEGDDSSEADDGGTCSKIFEWKLFKNPIFLTILAASTIYPFFGILIPTFLPLQAMFCGLSKAQVAMMITIGQCTDPFSRLFIGWFVDLNVISSMKLFASGFVVLAGLIFALPFMNTFASLMVFTLLHYSATGMMFTLHPVILVQQLGAARIASSFSICLLTESIVNLVFPPILGMLFEITGSWDTSIYLCAATTLSGFVLVAVSACVRARKNADKANEEKD